ncbi:unnamed protein product [Clonostachys byssicola]|uniref:Uncharacterized protein n=1 Tax=Clonostachys byssicola TaxID=160290 RepID=A0A9N9Y0Q5_9HYPO|nr:unnamed protein product [Clonostachys byssicola]
MPGENTRSSSRKDEAESSRTPAKKASGKTPAPVATPTKAKKVQVVAPDESQGDPFREPGQAQDSAEEESDDEDIPATTAKKIRLWVVGAHEDTCFHFRYKNAKVLYSFGNVDRCTGVHKLVLLNDGVHDKAKYLNRYNHQLLVCIRSLSG